MNIVVTGGNGFIGRKLVDALARQGHVIKVLSRRSCSPSHGSVQLVKGDLTSASCPLDQLLERCDVVFHCAGELRDVAAMKALHVDGTQRLLQGVLREAAQREHTIHWVQLSSVGAYGFPPEYGAADRVVTEDTPPQPIGVYEVTKTQSDEMVIRACGAGLLTCSIVRPSKVIGAGMPGQSLRTLGAMVRKGLFYYIGRPGAVATYVHVDDVVDVLLLCGFDARAKGKTFNISNDCPLEEMVQGIASALGVAPPRLRLPESLVRAMVSVASKVVSIPLNQEQISGLVRRTRYPYLKLARELDFVPRKSVPSTIGEVLTQ